MPNRYGITAIVISPEGACREFVLAKSPDDRINQFEAILGGHPEAVALPGNYLVIDENGKDGEHKINAVATALAHNYEVIRPNEYIAGAAILVPRYALR